MTQKITNRQLVTPGGGGSTPVILPDATNASFTMTKNATIFLPSGVLTTDKTITIPSGTNGDFIKIYNAESGFSWLLAGSAVYLSDGVSIVTQLFANTDYYIEFISGKWRVLN